MTLRMAYNIFTQKPKEELTDFRAGLSLRRPTRATTSIAERRGRDAGLLGSGFRGFSGAPAGYAGGDEIDAEGRHPPVGRE